MAFDAKDVILSASGTLQDAGAVRWPLTELLRYLNEGVREIVRLKPNASAATVEIELSAGPYQTLAAGHYLLIRAIRNLTSDAEATPRVGGKSITPVVREILDATIPGWQNPSVLPYAKAVDHIVQDMADPRVFYVIPGNDGTGLIEAVVSVMPDKIEQPGSPLDIESYDDLTVELPDEYEAILVNYVLYKAFAKDMSLAGSASRSNTHYQMFTSALGVSVQVEGVANVNTTNSQPDS